MPVAKYVNATQFSVGSVDEYISLKRSNTSLGNPDRNVSTFTTDALQSGELNPKHILLKKNWFVKKHYSVFLLTTWYITPKNVHLLITLAGTQGIECPLRSNHLVEYKLQEGLLMHGLAMALPWAYITASEYASCGGRTCYDTPVSFPN